MIKSLYISYDGATDSIGQSQIIPYLKGLSNNGIQFILLTFDKKECLAYKETISSIKTELSNSGIKWVCLRYHKNPAIVSTFFDIFRGILISVWLVYKYNIKCIHARSYVGALIGFVLKKLFRLKFIFDMRGFWADERFEGEIWKRKGLLYKITKFLEKRFLSASEEVVVLTQKAKIIINSLYYGTKASINIIPCMVDTDKFRFSAKDRQLIRDRYGISSRFVFLYSGSLEYWYMKDKMIDFFLIARDYIDNLCFLILSNMDKSHIEPIIYSKNISKDDFLILDRIPHSDMPKFISASDTGIFFITPVFSKKASCPTKFAEYISCGLPVIINSGIGDLDEIVTIHKVGTVVNNFSKEEYAYRIQKHIELMKDKDLNERCIKLAQDKFSLQSGIDYYRDIYYRLKQDDKTQG